MKITDISGTVALHNGVDMPYFGLGVFKTKDGEEVIKSIKWAAEVGYRHFDTAAIYNNEKGVGKAIKYCGYAREDIFVTSKVWNSNQGYSSTLKAFDSSLKKLDMDYLDLYLIHWPIDSKTNETWKALEKLYKDGRVKAIGVSNFHQHHIEKMLLEADIVPMVNQVEYHPLLIQQDLVDFCSSLNIRYQAWSPLMRGKILDYEIPVSIGKKYGKSAAQVVLRWDLQKGVLTIPKSINKDRIISNSKIFDFELSDEEIKQIDGLDNSNRVGPDPDNFNF